MVAFTITSLTMSMRMKITPRYARVSWCPGRSCDRPSSKVTSTDQQMTTHGKISKGVACRSVQLKACIHAWRMGPPTNAEWMPTRGYLGVYHNSVHEKTHNVPRGPPTPANALGASLRRVLCRASPQAGTRP
jgi:hypothetical protein